MSSELFNKYISYSSLEHDKDHTGLICHNEDLNEFLKEEGLTRDDVIVKSFNEFNSEEIAIVAGSELESMNHHSIVNFPQDFHTKLVQNETFNENERKMIMNAFVEALFSEIY